MNRKGPIKILFALMLISALLQVFPLAAGLQKNGADLACDTVAFIDSDGDYVQIEDGDCIIYEMRNNEDCASDEGSGRCKT